MISGKEAKHFLKLRTVDGKEVPHRFTLPCNLFIMLLHYWICFVAAYREWTGENSEGETKLVQGKHVRRVSWLPWCGYVMAWFCFPTIALLLVSSLQVYFLWAIWWVKGEDVTCHGEEMTCELASWIPACAIAAFTLSIWPEFVESARMVTWLWFSNGEVGEFKVTPWMRGYCYIYSILKMVYEGFFLHNGCRFLLLSDKNEDVLLNTVALAFIAELDELAFCAIASESIEEDIKENMAVKINFHSDGDDDDDSRSAWSFLFFNFVVRGFKLVVVVVIMMVYSRVDVYF